MKTNLAKYRNEKKLSQSQLAELSGISVRVIQHYEQQSRDINKAEALAVYKLANALDVNIEDLLEIKKD